MASPTPALMAVLALLAADATIELGFITSMVSYLHSGPPSGAFVIRKPANVPAASSDSTYALAGKPLHLLVNQGHTSNGAAGTALVLVGLLGALALTARWRFLSSSAPSRHAQTASRFLYGAWLALQVPALLLTLTALAYVFAVTTSHQNQTINQVVAAAIAGQRPYPLDQWTPQNWFAAVLQQLDLADADLRRDLTSHLRIMRGWQFNLIPLSVLQVAETALALSDYRRWRVIQRESRDALSRNAYDGKHTDRLAEAQQQPTPGSLPYPAPISSAWNDEQARRVLQYSAWEGV